MTVIPLNDLGRLHHSLRSEFLSAFESVLDHGGFVRGPEVGEFERAFAETVGAKHCIGCSNGTVALSAAYTVLGLAPGEEIITTPHTWIATAGAASYIGGKVVFADTLPGSCLLDPRAVESKINEKTRGIVPVHLFGQPANMKEFSKLAAEHNLWVVEDSAQAHLAEYAGEALGFFGDAATYSFFPGKNLGALGDAGCITTNNDQVAQGLRDVIDHGGKGDHSRVGMNFRLNSLQAAFLLRKLPLLREWTRMRQAIAYEYSEAFREIEGLGIPEVQPDRTHVFHQYVLRSERRDALREYLLAHGVETGIHYPRLVNQTRAFGGEPVDGRYPCAESAVRSCLSLPIFPTQTHAEVKKVVSLVKAFYER